MILSENILIQYISERLGHENTTITLQTYAHLLSEKRTVEESKAMAFFNTIWGALFLIDFDSFWFNLNTLETPA